MRYLTLDRDDGSLVLVHQKVVQGIEAAVERGGRSREAGGIFIGSYRGDHVEVTSLTQPMAADVRRRFLFNRSDRGHQRAAMRAWRESGGTDTFVGEWHTHPEARPTPSWQDRRTWEGLLSRSERPLVFAIGGWDGIWWGIGVAGAFRRVAATD